MERLNHIELLKLITPEIITARNFLYVPFFPANKPKTLQEVIFLTEHLRIGNCSAKHYWLAHQFRKYNIPTRFLTYPFYWKNLRVNFPNEIRNLADMLPPQYHLALSISSFGKELLIDVTWDPSLHALGFPVNSQDLEHMQLAVKPIGEVIVHNTLEERWSFIESLKKSIPDPELVQCFYVKLNSWLNETRESQNYFSNNTQ